MDNSIANNLKVLKILKIIQLILVIIFSLLTPYSILGIVFGAINSNFVLMGISIALFILFIIILSFSISSLTHTSRLHKMIFLISIGKAKTDDELEMLMTNSVIAKKMIKKYTLERQKEIEEQK